VYKLRALLKQSNEENKLLKNKIEDLSEKNTEIIIGMYAYACVCLCVRVCVGVCVSVITPQQGE
jgi:3-dehydroquinate dehydratase